MIGGKDKKWKKGTKKTNKTCPRDESALTAEKTRRTVSKVSPPCV